MADAPAGAKVSGAEIILIVVLVLGALGVFFGNPIKPYPAPAAPAPTPSAPLPHCGITLTRPTHLEKVSQVVTITGTILTCDTATPILNTPLNAQIIDANGTPMSDYTAMTVTAANETSGTFNANIPLTGAPAAGTGYALVVGPNAGDGTSMSARVPIIFSK